MRTLPIIAAVIAAVLCAPVTAQDSALYRLEAAKPLLDILDQLDREAAIQALPEEVRELLHRQVLPMSAIGSELAKARAARDWEAEVAVLTRWAEHEAVRRERARARAAAAARRAVELAD